MNVGNITVKQLYLPIHINIYNSLFDYTINDSNLILSSNHFNNQHYNSIINIDSSYDTDIKIYLFQVMNHIYSNNAITYIKLLTIKI